MRKSLWFLRSEKCFANGGVRFDDRGAWDEDRMNSSHPCRANRRGPASLEMAGHG